MSRKRSKWKFSPARKHRPAARQAAGWGARFLLTAVNQYMVAGGKSFLSKARGGDEVAVQSAY